MKTPPYSFIGHLSPTGEGKSVAFTLSEVLITLVIIGIIAAITIVALSRTSEKYILNNQFKKAYSVISNAIKKADMDLGGNTQCYYKQGAGYSSSDCTDFFRQFERSLSIQKKCIGNAKAEGCIPTPYIKDYQCDSVNFPGFCQNNVENLNTVLNLADGTIIINYSTTSPLFLIDVNGAKGPNKYGKDIFDFIIISDGVNGLKIRAKYRTTDLGKIYNES